MDEVTGKVHPDRVVSGLYDTLDISPANGNAVSGKNNGLTYHSGTDRCFVFQPTKPTFKKSVTFFTIGGC